VGLDISFLDDDSRLAGLDGERLTNVPGLLNVALTLGVVLKYEEDIRAIRGETAAAYLAETAAASA